MLFDAALPGVSQLVVRRHAVYAPNDPAVSDYQTRSLALVSEPPPEMDSLTPRVSLAPLRLHLGQMCSHSLVISEADRRLAVDLQSPNHAAAANVCHAFCAQSLWIIHACLSALHPLPAAVAELGRTAGLLPISRRPGRRSQVCFRDIVFGGATRVFRYRGSVYLPRSQAICRVLLPAEIGDRSTR